MYVCVAVLSALVLQEEAGLGKIFYLSENLILAYYGLSFGLNVLCTLLIAVRLYYHKVQLERIFGATTGSPYTSIATLLIESAALYATWSLLYLILCVLHSPAQILVLGTMCQIQVIAPLLIILWSARGKTWNSGKSYGESSGGGESSAEGGSSVMAGSGGRPSTPSSPRRIAKFVRVGAQLTRVSGGFGTADDDLPPISQNGSSSTIIEGDTKRGGADADADSNGGGDVNLIELGLCVSEPSSIRVDPTA